MLLRRTRQADLERAGRLLLSIADGLATVLLAPVCAACHEPLEQPTRGAVCAACWAWIIDPIATHDFVRRFLVTAPHSKLFCFGGDYIAVENVPGCRAEPQRERTRQRPASVVLQRVHDRPQ